jgi:hypothetical protein
MTRVRSFNFNNSSSKIHSILAGTYHEYKNIAQ